MGNDGAAGTVAVPWRTFAHAMTILSPGDRLIVRGGRYPEMVIIAKQGTLAMPIVVVAAPGETPVIDGADTLDDWREISPGVWETPAPAGSQLGRGLLMLGENPLLEAAWPSGTTDVFAAKMAAATVHDFRVTIPDLPTGTWTGALVFGVVGWGWGAQAARITRVDGQVVTVVPVVPPADGAWFNGAGRVRILGGAAQLEPGTWTLIDGRIRVRPKPGWDIHALRWATRPYGLDLGGAHHVQVKGLRLVASTVVMFAAEDCVIEACHVVWPDRNWQVQPYTQDGGIQLAGTRNRLQGCSVSGGTGNGIAISGIGNQINQCQVTDVDAAGTYAAGILISGNGHRITASTVDGCGRDGIHFDHHAPGRHVLDGLDVGRVGLVARDCGVVYAWGQDGGGTVISHSWFHDNRAETAGPLVYFDDDARGFVLNRIVAWGSRSQDAAVRCNGGVRNVTVAHLTSFACAPIGANTYKAEGSPDPIFRIVNAAHLTDPAHQLRDYLHLDFRAALGNTTLRNRGLSDPLSGEISGSAPALGAYEDGAQVWRPGVSP